MFFFFHLQFIIYILQQHVVLARQITKIRKHYSLFIAITICAYISVL